MLLSLLQLPLCVGTIIGTSLSPQESESVPAAVLIPSIHHTSHVLEEPHLVVALSVFLSASGSRRLLLCVSGPSFRWGV